MVNTKNVQASKLLQRAGEDPEGIRKETEGPAGPRFKQQASSAKQQATSTKRQAPSF
jgi:hypothetical protein